MAHYAFINSDGIVVEVIPGRNEKEVIDGISDWEAHYETQRNGLTCRRTSYNTRGGKHLFGGQPFRFNYAGVGYTFDADRDAFIPPKPFESWVLDEATCLWYPPTPRPEIEFDENGEPLKSYTWDEETTSWVEVPGETV